MSLLYADTPAAAGAAATGAPADSGPMSLITRMGPMLPLVFIVGLFYWLLIRPQQKQQKEREAQLKELKEGDKVVLVSGVHATVSKVEENDVLRLQIADGVVIKAQRTAVDRKVLPPTEAKAG